MVLFGIQVGRPHTEITVTAEVRRRTILGIYDHVETHPVAVLELLYLTVNPGVIATVEVEHLGADFIGDCRTAGPRGVLELGVTGIQSPRDVLAVAKYRPRIALG